MFSPLNGLSAYWGSAPNRRVLAALPLRVGELVHVLPAPVVGLLVGRALGLLLLDELRHPLLPDLPEVLERLDVDPLGRLEQVPVGDLVEVPVVLVRASAGPAVEYALVARHCAQGGLAASLGGADLLRLVFRHCSFINNSQC